MTTALGRAPKEFSLDAEAGRNLAVEFDLWLEDLDGYFDLANVTTFAQKKKLLLNLAGLPVRRLVAGLSVPVAAAPTDGSEADVFTPLTTALRDHFRPSINATSERHKFSLRRQEDGESLSTYVTALRGLAGEV